MFVTVDELVALAGIAAEIGAHGCIPLLQAVTNTPMRRTIISKVLAEEICEVVIIPAAIANVGTVSAI